MVDITDTQRISLLTHEELRVFAIRQMVTISELTEAMIRMSENDGIRSEREKNLLLKITQLEKSVSHDHLTGLLDRHGMENEIHKVIKTIVRGGGMGVGVYVDLDKFKLINDICDHHTGDIVLSLISKILIKNLRPTDLISRVGGDEFFIFLKDVSIPVAKKIIEKIQMHVRDISVDHERFVTLQKVAKRESIIDFSSGFFLIQNKESHGAPSSNGDSMSTDELKALSLSSGLSFFSILLDLTEKKVPKFASRRNFQE